MKITTNKIRVLTNAAVLFIVQAATVSIISQVPMKAKDSKSSVNVSDFEKINLYDGKFRFNLPLNSIGGRGSGNGFNLNLESSWRRDSVIIGYSGASPNVVDTIDPDPYALNGIITQTGGYMVISTSVAAVTEVPYCSNETLYFAGEKAFNVNFAGFGVSSLSFISEQHEDNKIVFTGQGCLPSTHTPMSIGSSFIATDGSGTKFITGPIMITDDLLSVDGYGNTNNVYPSGFLKFTDGTTYVIEGGLVTQITDKNGNVTTITNSGYSLDIRESRPTSIKDSLSREILSSSDSNNYWVTYKGVNGVPRAIRVGLCSAADPCLRTGQSLQWLHTLFPWIGQYHYSDRLTGGGGVKDVEFPNGQKYKFFYNSYTELARVELPTGGAVEYEYESVANYSTDRRIVERRVYSDGVNLDHKIIYQYSHNITHTPGNVIPSETWTKVKLYDNQNNLKSVTKHYFGGCIAVGSSCQVPGNWYEPGSNYLYFEGSPSGVETYGSDGTTLLRKSETAYEPGRQTSFGRYLDFRVSSVTNTLNETGQVSKTTYVYDGSTNYNLQTDVFEYDYGSISSWQVGSFIRRTHTDYEKGTAYTSDQARILNLPLQTWVSSDYNGSQIVSRTTHEYDNYNYDSNHAPLISRLNLTGHDSNYGNGYTTRGNLTKTTSYASAMTWTGAVSSYLQYDIAGNVVKTIDAKGNAATIDYADRFGSPDSESRSNSAPGQLNGQATFAFASSTTFASSATNVPGWTTYVQRDFYTGAVVDAEDINGNIGTTFYNDILDRPTQTISNNNRAELRSQATVTYDDVGRKVTVTADSKTFGDNLIKTEAFYDGLGRTFESRDYETASNYIVAKTEYDKLGRAYKSTNPYRPHLNETAQWTTTAFDDLGRVTEVKTPDNATVSKSYSGSTVTVTDQAGRSRSGTSDAIGRLLKVTEHNNGTNYDSFYNYDVLGRLHKTAQTSGSTTQNRYFMYDDLGRLIRARQVEQGTNSNLNLTDPITGNNSWSTAYSYDNNGNIISTTDALNRSITGTYDNLNRLRFRNYLDSTPDVTFTYDDVNIANSKAKLTAVSSSVSATNYTAFDVLGRIKSSTQTTGGQTYAFSDYSYDFSGALVSQVYPSGRVVTTETDELGRLSRVASQLPNQVQKTMLSNLDYTSFGAVKQAKLGNGKWESAQFDNKRLQVTQIGLGGSAGDTSLLKLEFSYGTTANNGSLLEQKITVPGASNQIVQNYSYDHLNRLASATETVTGNSTPTWKQTFSYDRFGNRRFDAANTTTLGSCASAVCNPNIDLATNRLASSDGYTFNAEGNLVSNPESQLFIYDAENRLIQMQNSSTQVTSNYSYDGQGKRVKKTLGNQDTYFVYDAFGKLVAEYTTNQTITQNGTQYLTADALGSPRVATNAIGGVASRHDYMPFGEEVASGVGGRTTAQGYGQADNARQKFTGYERDDESGLDFAQNRYFSSKHARFTSVDPLAASANIKAPQSLNRYSYGNNSPYKFTDPTGLISESQYDGTQDKIDQGKKDEELFNRALARYIFERTSQGYIDDTGGMTRSMFDVTGTQIVRDTSASYSITNRLLTFNTSIKTTITRYNSAGKVINSTSSVRNESFVTGASSGTGECLNDADCAKDDLANKSKGPIPLGEYTIFTKSLIVMDTPNSVAKIGKTIGTGLRGVTGLPLSPDWGSFRVPITPNTAHSFRDGYYLHGGTFPGSLGCVDVGGGEYGNASTRRIISLLKQDSDYAVSLEVIR